MIYYFGVIKFMCSFNVKTNSEDYFQVENDINIKKTLKHHFLKFFNIFTKISKWLKFILWLKQLHIINNYKKFKKFYCDE